MAEDQAPSEDTTPDAPATEAAAPAAQDFSWAPEQFVKDGALDTESFRSRYDELATFAAQEQERREAMIKDPEGFEIGLPELNLPEGLTLPKDAEGNDVLPVLDPNDPDIKSLRELGVELGMTQDGMNRLLHLYAVKSVREAAEDYKQYEAERAKLGPDGKARMGTMQKELQRRLPAAMAEELVASITTADGLRAIEKLLSPGAPAVPTPNSRPSLDGLSPMQLLEIGQKSRKAS